MGFLRAATHTFCFFLVCRIVASFFKAYARLRLWSKLIFFLFCTVSCEWYVTYLFGDYCRQQYTKSKSIPLFSFERGALVWIERQGDRSSSNIVSLNRVWKTLRAFSFVVPSKYLFLTGSWQPGDWFPKKNTLCASVYFLLFPQPQTFSLQKFSRLFGRAFYTNCVY